jgi:transcriptional regulator of acetoin/glycerol metabolism
VVPQVQPVLALVHLRDGAAAVSEKRPYRKVSLLEQAADEARKALLYRELAAMNGQVGRVAQRLGTNRTYCYALMKRYGIKLERR